MYIYVQFKYNIKKNKKTLKLFRIDGQMNSLCKTSIINKGVGYCIKPCKFSVMGNF